MVRQTPVLEPRFPSSRSMGSIFNVPVGASMSSTVSGTQPALDKHLLSECLKNSKGYGFFPPLLSLSTSQCGFSFVETKDFLKFCLTFINWLFIPNLEATAKEWIKWGRRLAEIGNWFFSPLICPAVLMVSQHYLIPYLGENSYKQRFSGIRHWLAKQVRGDWGIQRKENRSYKRGDKRPHIGSVTDFNLSKMNLSVFSWSWTKYLNSSNFITFPFAFTSPLSLHLSRFIETSAHLWLSLSLHLFSIHL